MKNNVVKGSLCCAGCVINVGFSYLQSKVKGDAFFSDTRDFGGGRSDAVIIKDISNAANCAASVGGLLIGNSKG